MTKQDLKERISRAVDDLGPEIMEMGQFIYDHPELGYKEKAATDYMADILSRAGFEVTRDIALTGVRAQWPETFSGPTLAVLGELDAVPCREHPHAHPGTGAVHACGHHIQAAVMAGMALVLKQTGALEALGGNLVFMAVPAEEFVEMEFREGLKEDQKISYFGGKQEMVARGQFDGIDMALMMHALDMGEGKKALIAPTGNGFVGKKIIFKGKEAHAGSAPEEGINALNAAMLAMNNIHAQRDTFADPDRVRVHPIITRGGDAVNVVPAEVHMETYVRARSRESLLDANAKVDRALKAGAAALGAGIEIRDMPGYLPLLNTPELDELLAANLDGLGEGDAVIRGGDFTGSFDFGDISHLMPCLHPFFGGVGGSLHSKEFRMTDPETAYLLPVKALAHTAVDLLWEKAQAAQAVLDDFNPVMTKAEYLEWLSACEGIQVLEMEK